MSEREIHTHDHHFVECGWGPNLEDAVSEALLKTVDHLKGNARVRSVSHAFDPTASPETAWSAVVLATTKTRDEAVDLLPSDGVS